MRFVVIYAGYVNHAFRDCTSLEEIHNNNPIPQTIEQDCFGGVDVKKVLI